MNQTIYQIKDWNAHFENDRSRNRLQCSFVCVPNKQHGMGFCRVMAEQNGAAIYGIWHCIVGACSQQKQRDGWLTDNGEQTGTAWGADDLALKFRRPVEEIKHALDILCSTKVGWMICHKTANKNNETPQDNHEVTAESPPTAIEEKRREGREEKEIVAPATKNGEHSAFIKGWTENFKAHFGFEYVFDGGRDGKAVKTLLATKILLIDLLEIAKQAWNHQHTFACKQASTIHGFNNSLNPIRTELKDLTRNGKPSMKPDYSKGF